ncbi:hypothetical protein [Desulfobotulus sp.]|uniref:hypothetical protein n=1 Tax=Desulfobotulus sp. TaxID=1940337 RepID=UPI002A36CF75|nr:hypothetical protein [Desulfobotulus sp.]MDY0164294.1 hypothetical protein [Desulfobotulus sp.]
MTQSIRHKILDDLRAVCSQIRTAEGYSSDIGANIVLADGKRTLDQLPALWISPGTEAAERTAYGEDSITLPVTLRAGLRYVLDSDPTIQETALSAMAEGVLADLRTVLDVLAGVCDLADDILYKSGGVEDWPEWGQGEAALTVTLSAEIRYRTSRNNPYA